MRSVSGLLVIFLVAVALVPASSAQEEFTGNRWCLAWEVGPVWQTVNDLQIPNTAEGTRFSLVDAVGKGSWFAQRVTLEYHLTDRSSLRALVAPLSIEAGGNLAASTAFNGAEFAPGPASATYKFNSYRLSYRYLWKNTGSWRWHIGFTAKIRDAKVALRQGDLASVKTNVGFVPLLHLAARRTLGERWHLDLNLDALAGGPGRAEDLAIKIGYRPEPAWTVSLGYRMIEGGADVEEVYSFAWLHYATGSVAVEF